MVFSLWSLLGPLLFLLYLNDFDDPIDGFVARFADNTKMVGGTDGTDEAECLLNDLDMLEKWAKKWQMECHVAKCAVNHVGCRT